MRNAGIIALLLGLLASTTSAQGVRDTLVAAPADTVHIRMTTSTSTWGPGERGTLPVRAHFRRTTAEALLDSTTVRDAVVWAMLSVGVEPDLVFGAFAARNETPPFIALEVDAYEAGEVRIDVALIEAGRAWRPACGGGSNGTTSTTLHAALRITHKVRDTLECAIRRLGLR